MAYPRVIVRREGGLWTVRESWKLRPSVQCPTWAQAMKQAAKYADLMEKTLQRQDRRYARRKGWT